MEIDRLFGLPAHPLIVHAAVVLLPMAAIATVLVALVPRLRRHYAPLAFALAFAAMVAVGLAQGSGESLEDRVAETELVEEHTEAGEQVLPWAIGVAVIAAAVAAVTPIADRRPGLGLDRRVVGVGLATVALVAGIGATAVVVDVGHSGAEASWNDTITAGVDADSAGVDLADRDDEDHDDD